MTMTRTSTRTMSIVPRDFCCFCDHLRELRVLRGEQERGRVWRAALTERGGDVPPCASADCVSGRGPVQRLGSPLPPRRDPPGAHRVPRASWRAPPRCDPRSTGAIVLPSTTVRSRFCRCVAWRSAMARMRSAAPGKIWLYCSRTVGGVSVPRTSRFGQGFALGVAARTAAPSNVQRFDSAVRSCDSCDGSSPKRDELRVERADLGASEWSAFLNRIHQLLWKDPGRQCTNHSRLHEHQPPSLSD